MHRGEIAQPVVVHRHHRRIAPLDHDELQHR
jgi:hypothetical protein